MRQVILCISLLLLFFVSPLIAQDIIVKKDKSTIYCHVNEVTDSVIYYAVWGDQSETSYLLNKSLVSSIIYANGKREIIDKQFSTNNPYKKVKRLKTIGWIGGGVLAGVGTIFLATSIRLAANSSSDGTGLSSYFSVVELYYGLSCVALGAGFTTIFHVAANKQKKKIDAALQTSTIYKYDITFPGGSSFSLGADLLNDRILGNQTIGLGMRYSF